MASEAVPARGQLVSQCVVPGQVEVRCVSTPFDTSHTKFLVSLPHAVPGKLLADLHSLQLHLMVDSRFLHPVHGSLSHGHRRYLHLHRLSHHLAGSYVRSASSSCFCFEADSTAFLAGSSGSLLPLPSPRCWAVVTSARTRTSSTVTRTLPPRLSLGLNGESRIRRTLKTVN